MGWDLDRDVATTGGPRRSGRRVGVVSGPISRWQAPIDPAVSVFEVNQPSDWAQLVRQFARPARAPTLAGSSPGRTSLALRPNGSSSCPQVWPLAPAQTCSCRTGLPLPRPSTAFIELDRQVDVRGPCHRGPGPRRPRRLARALLGQRAHSFVERGHRPPDSARRTGAFGSDQR